MTKTDPAKPPRPGITVPVPIDFPVELLQAIDAEALRLGVTRQHFITQRFAHLLPQK